MPCDDPGNPPLATINFEDVAVGAPGTTGLPPDDIDLPAPFNYFIRSPAITYEVFGPDGSFVAKNANPSGNREWEIFCIGLPGTTECEGTFTGALAGEDGTPLPPDVIVPELPAGVYEVRVNGLDMENLNAFRFSGGAVAPPCDECDGGVNELTLEYNGTISNPDPIIRVEKDSSTIYFEGPVGPNGRFTVADGGEKLGDFDIFIDGVLNTSIHTSCSQPIFPGLVTGDFTIVEGFSKDNGPICIDIGCSDCDGGVTDLTLLYQGASTVELTIYDSSSADPNKILFGPATRQTSMTEPRLPAVLCAAARCSPCESKATASGVSPNIGIEATSSPLATSRTSIPAVTRVAMRSPFAEVGRSPY